jgi:hypothetical protein
MTPKEKAKDLVDKFWYSLSITLEQAKECALIAVDEILNSNSLEPQLQRHRINGVKPEKIHLEYWIQVKQEILAL